MFSLSINCILKKMDKLYETNVKFNKESSSLLIEKSKEENELLNNNNKNGVCCKDITNGCHSNNSQIENNVENNTETIENENPVIFIYIFVFLHDN